MVMGNRQEFRAEFQYNLGGRCAKMLKQDYATEKVEPRAHYSPEEAGEILRLAAELAGKHDYSGTTAHNRS
jgi:hypothetical protein